MTEKELKQKVDDIIAISGDDEAAHSREDDLLIELISEFCPDWVKKEITRLSNADFCRWCA